MKKDLFTYFNIDDILTIGSNINFIKIKERYYIFLGNIIIKEDGIVNTLLELCYFLNINYNLKEDDLFINVLKDYLNVLLIPNVLDEQTSIILNKYLNYIPEELLEEMKNTLIYLSSLDNELFNKEIKVASAKIIDYCESKDIIMMQKSVDVIYVSKYVLSKLKFSVTKEELQAILIYINQKFLENNLLLFPNDIIKNKERVYIKEIDDYYKAYGSSLIIPLYNRNLISLNISSSYLELLDKIINDLNNKGKILKR